MKICKKGCEEECEAKYPECGESLPPAPSPPPSPPPPAATPPPPPCPPTADLAGKTVEKFCKAQCKNTVWFGLALGLGCTLTLPP